MATMLEWGGLLNYAIFFATFAGIFAVTALGLNVQWGLSGQLNFGIAGFFAIGSYTSAILTSEPVATRLGGFGLPIVVGLAAAMALSALVAWAVGWVTKGLRTDYLAIATIGVAECIRLIVKNEDWLTNGVRGIPAIPNPGAAWLGSGSWGMLLVVAACVIFAYAHIEAARASPWGRLQLAIRENERGATAAGKNVARARLEAFVLGAAFMGLGGALYAHLFGFVSPEAFGPNFSTFLVWVMLIVGGSGNNKGAILGSFVVWLIWSGTEILTNRLPVEYANQAGALRLLLIGLLVQVVLIYRPQGLMPEKL
jgi:branched-chain amino acid transport system permease protein